MGLGKLTKSRMKTFRWEKQIRGLFEYKNEKCRRHIELLKNNLTGNQNEVQFFFFFQFKRLRINITLPKNLKMEHQLSLN